MKRTRLSLLIGLAAVLATVVSAQQPGMGRGPHPGPGGPGGPGGPPDLVLGPAGRILHELDLSSEQRQQIRETLESQIDGQLGTLARSFMDARHALELRVWDPQATQDEIHSASDLVAERAQALEEARHGLALEILALLTDEQRQAFREMLAEGPMPPPGPPRHRGR